MYSVYNETSTTPLLIHDLFLPPESLPQVNLEPTIIYMTNLTNYSKLQLTTCFDDIVCINYRLLEV